MSGDLVDEELSCGRCRRPVRLPWRETPPASGHDRGLARVVAMHKWPEGYICQNCYSRACETYGRCANCGVDRLVPGITSDGGRICADCAGGLGDFTCHRCGREGRTYKAKTCERCALTDRLRDVLDDGSGSVRTELVPLFESVRGMHRPRSGIVWLSKPAPAAILRALAQSEAPLTHDGLDTLGPPKSATHIRDLLMECGVLPRVDRFLHLFEQWLPGWLASISDVEHRKTLERFATWEVLRNLRMTAAQKPIGNYRNQVSRDQLRQAAAFLADLASHGRSLPDCGQADIDRWLADTSAVRQQSRRFLRWAINRGHTRRLRLPKAVRAHSAPISQKQRLDLIRRVHTGEGMAPIDRVVALLILLYAQPLSKIARLTTDDVIHDEDEVLIRLGDPPIPVPAPFANVLTDYVANRSNLMTATNPNSRLLFPGRRAGQPIHPTSLRLRLQVLGIPNLNGRARAIREMLLRAPAPVIAGMLGYHPNCTEKLAAEAGATWKRYAPGDHSKAR